VLAINSHRNRDSPVPDSAFIRVQFFVLVITSIVLPVFILYYLNSRKTIRRHTVLYYGVFLLLLGAVDVGLLRRLAVIAKQTPTLLDDFVFASEISVCLYILPVIAVGVGVNLISHVLILHLRRVESPD